MQHVARKRFGQHFLHDQAVIDHIIQAIGPVPGQNIVEIGPGLGALTRPLLEAAGSLDVVELDRDVIPRLMENCAGLGDLRVHAVDVLKFDFARLATGGEGLRIVGNLPYNISTPLIFHMLNYRGLIRDMHFMVQKEVAERMAATAGDSAYGRLSVMVQLRCAVIPLFTVGPEAFKPAPKVESAVVRMLPYDVPRVQILDDDAVALVVSRAFGQRRKTLRNCLKGLFAAEQIDALGIDPARRPETLTVEEFAKLGNALARMEQPG